MFPTLNEYRPVNNPREFDHAIFTLNMDRWIRNLKSAFRYALNRIVIELNYLQIL